jgi:alpha-L-fucosidase
MNVGPKPNGEIQIEQEAILREIALWNFANSEAIYAVKPMPIIKEEGVWYTQSNDEKYIYAFILRSSPDEWKYGERTNFVLSNVIANEKSQVEILGYKSELVEYKQDFDAKTYVSASPLGLTVSAVNGQRFYTNNKWPNAVVLKISNAKGRLPQTDKTKQSSMDGAK